MKRWTVCVCVVAALAAAVGCGGADGGGGGGGGENNSAANNSSDIDAGNNGGEDTGGEEVGGEDVGEEDIPTVGDVGSANNGGCDALDARAEAWPLHGRVSSGEVTASQAGGVVTAELDASAGGSQAAAGMPFVYLDLDAGAKVEVTDLEAGAEDTTWELAFRRTSIFINGGDAGPGAVEIARLTGADFDAVSAADLPANGAFITEESVDATCQTVPPESGFGGVVTTLDTLNPDTSSGSWFDYGGGGHTVAPYPDHVYILRGADGGATYKLSIVAWESGMYTLKWAAL